MPHRHLVNHIVKHAPVVDGRIYHIDFESTYNLTGLDHIAFSYPSKAQRDYSFDDFHVTISDTILTVSGAITTITSHAPIINETILGLSKHGCHHLNSRYLIHDITMEEAMTDALVADLRERLSATGNKLVLSIFHSDLNISAFSWRQRQTIV